MTDNYEDKLWGKIDFLHEKTLKEHSNLNIFSDIIIKYQHTLLDFSKSIDNIKNKNAELIEEKNNTIDLTLTNFKQVLKSHIVEFKECGEHMKSTILVPIMQSIDEKYNIEKDMYSQYNKTKTSYINSKTYLEKAKKEFDNGAKLCEKNILNLVQLKAFALNNAEDVSKTEERVKLSITNTKNLEDKYYKCLEDANKARENEIKKQNELLKFYQIMHTDFYLKINCVISYFIPMVKKMYASILLSLDALEDRCKKIKIGEDINDFIEKNKTDLKPEEPLPFIPYYPQADITNKNITGNDKKDLENLDINYNVILTLHQNFRDIRKDLNMEEEKKKARLRFLCTKIFKIGPGMNFKNEEKTELISLLKESFYKSYFLITLSKQRTKGRFQRSETLIQDLSEILHYILDESEKIKDYENAKNCIILSQTFYHDKQNKKNKKDIKKDNKTEGGIKNERKIYLFEYIKNYKWLKSVEFWEGIMEYMIQIEVNKNEEINKKNNVNETPEEKKNRLSNIGFSQVLSYTNSMIEFKINKEDINKVVDIFVKRYEIDPSMAEAIYENIKNTPYPQADEESEKYFFELERIYEKKKEDEKNNKIIDYNINDQINLLKQRSQTISLSKKNELLINDNRSKSFKEKTSPFKDINKGEQIEKTGDIKNVEEFKEKSEGIQKNENKIVEEVKINEGNQINEENKIEQKKELEKNEIKNEDNKNGDNKNEEKQDIKKIIEEKLDDK